VKNRTGSICGPLPVKFCAVMGGEHAASAESATPAKGDRIMLPSWQPGSQL